MHAIYNMRAQTIFCWSHTGIPQVVTIEARYLNGNRPFSMLLPPSKNVMRLQSQEYPHGLPFLLED